MIIEKIAEYNAKIEKQFNIGVDKIANYHMLSFILTENFGGGKIRGVEIGVQEGNLDMFMLTFFKDLEMTGIDPSLGDYSKLSQFAERFKFIHSISDDAIKFLKPPYDFIYVDGGHSYEQCRRDILNYSPLLKKGGILCGHDYHSNHPDVIRAVKEIESDVFIGSDLTWWTYV